MHSWLIGSHFSIHLATRIGQMEITGRGRRQGKDHSSVVFNSASNLFRSQFPKLWVVANFWWVLEHTHGGRNTSSLSIFLMWKLEQVLIWKAYFHQGERDGTWTAEGWRLPTRAPRLCPVVFSMFQAKLCLVLADENPLTSENTLWRQGLVLGYFLCLEWSSPLT